MKHTVIYSIRFIIYAFAFTVFLACSQQPKMTLHQQVEELLNSEDLIKDKYGRAIILKTEYCLENQCEEYFKDFKNKVFFYSKSDVFIYNFSGYLEIESIDEESFHYKKVSWN